METDPATELNVVPVSSDWAEQFKNTVGFYPPRGEAAAGAPPAEAQPQGSTEPAGQGGNEGGGDAGSKGSDGGFNWGLFPDVPEEQRALLEPHLKKVQAHVTKLEQQLAANPDSERVQSLVAFEDAFNRDPMGTWLQMASRLQEQGIIHQDLDLEAVTAYASGKEPPEDQGQQQPPQPVQGQEGQQQEDPRIAQLEAQLRELQGNLTQEQTQRQERIQNELLERQFGEMRSQLSEAGVPEDALPSPQQMAAHIIAHQGNVQAAIDDLKSFRESTLKGFAEKNKPKSGSDEVDMPKGVPGTPEPKSNDAWRAADQGAKAHLRRAAESAAQG